MLFLGIDLGTSSIKLVVMDEKGEMKTEFIPTPAGVNFSKEKKDQNQ